MAEKCKPFEAYKKMYDMCGGEYFSQKSIYKWAKQQFTLRSLNQKDDADSFRDMKGPITIDCLATVNSTSH